MESDRRVGVVGVAVMLVALLLVGAVPALGQVEWEECPDCCFEDVVVSGAGAWWANARYEYGEFEEGRLLNGRPLFYFLEINGDLSREGLVYYFSNGWNIEAMILNTVTLDWYCNVEYCNPSDALTPPSTGWVLNMIDALDCGSIDGQPAPTLSGGEPCRTGDLTPAGTVGFLDRGWVEGEEPPVVGEMTVSAVYGIGELVTGCCTATGDVSYLTLTWYAVTIGDDYDVREPIDSKVVRAGSDGCFCFTIETTGWAPGYYDLRLGIPGEGCEWIRVEVVPPPE